ncbi:hypothetical protein, conserved [Leishmania lindenbergi]|uniref:Uncharacterized protein n=1 Tax=Leishmania lindenbergi TaxID=651832 RepID=A0AAW3A227_9TRYP
MSEDKRPRFLQQTTSQLLHQQEALRKRREMLERESTKPPAMRFGTNTPPRNAARHGRSPLLSSSASERQTSHSTPPPSSGARRELNWSRPEDEKTAERAPMRFSMLFRPSPTPAVLARPRSATGLHTPSSPSLREVNTSDQVDARVTKFCKESSSPRTVSPHSPVQQRGRVECDRSPSENTTHRTDVPLHLLRCSFPRPVQVIADETAQVEVVCTARGGATPARATVELHASTPPPDPRVTCAEEQDKVTGTAAFSNTFPVPRFTPISPVVAATAKRAQQTQEEEQSTPIRLAAGEFRTPRPLTRLSTAVTPTIDYPAPVQGEGDGERGTSSLDTRADTGSAVFPPLALLPQVLGAAEASVDVQEFAQPSRSTDEAPTHTEHGTVPPEMVYPIGSAEIGAPQEATSLSFTVASALPHRQTLSPPRRNNASPVPTTQDLIHSMQVSAEKQPHSRDRPTPSPVKWHSCRATATPSRTTSPLPTPVPPSDRLMTEFGSLTEKCCDRPTPVSLSSQPAGGDARNATAGTSSASPWPTTENIISSIMAGTSEGQRRGREVSAAATPHTVPREDDGVASGEFSNEEVDVPHTDSPNMEAPEKFDVNTDNEGEESGRDDALYTTLQTNATAHTPSPVPSDRQYGQSILASTTKRRCGRPTPSERHVSVAASEDSNGRAAHTTSASPQPSANHLLLSLDVSIEKSCQRCKPAERATEAEGSGSGDEATRKTPGHLTAIRTPSPTPTPEHVIASLQASAEKRTRSGAIDTSREPKDFSAATMTSASCGSYQSPTLTPQNVKDSMQKLMREQQQMARSDAPPPIRPWTEGASKDTANGARCGGTWNASASPVVTAEDVDTALETLEREQRYHSRSSRAPRVSGISSEEENTALPRESVVFAVKVAEAVHMKAIRDTHVSSPQGTVSPSVVSPIPSELAVASAMFFDCVSAPPTPALESIVAAKRATGSPELPIPEPESAHVPPQFYNLQREVAAIAEGRSRTCTPPPPLQVSELRSPLPVPAMSLEEGDTTPADISLEQRDVAVSASLHEQQDPISSYTAAVERDPEDEEMARRSSLILVHPTKTPQPLLQHPHEPMPTVSAPSTAPVQVPCTSTPPRRHPLQQERFLTSEGGPVSNACSAHRESPLPRPVSLRSQVPLEKLMRVSHTHPHSRSPAPGWRAPCASAFKGDVMPAQLSWTGVQPPKRCTTAMQHDEDTSLQADLFDPKNDWMDLIEPLRPQTITVSPQGGTVVYTEHSLTSPAGDPARPVGPMSPSISRKRSRSAQTPLAAARQIAVATPASIALTTDGSASSGAKSLRVAATPISDVSQTPRSSTRGRKSQAEELLDMLPAEVIAEVARIEEAEEVAAAASADLGDCRPSLGSSAGRFSGASDGDSTLGLVSTISQRVSKRPRRTYHNYDYYIQYLEGLASSSAKKARKSSGRRMHRAVMKDVASNTAKTVVQRGGGDQSPATATVSTAESPAPRGSGSQSASSRGSGRAAARTKVSTMHASEEVVVSPQALSSTPVGGRRQLEVSTCLSAELQKALFQQPSPVKAKRQRNPRRTSSKLSAKSTKTAKKSPTTSPKNEGSAKSSTKKKATKKAPPSMRGKRSVKKFCTAKSMRLPRRGAKDSKA